MSALTVKPPAISGISATDETVLRTVYPSIAATGAGRLMGQLLDLIPLRINGIRLSNLLFALPLAPLAMTVYVVLKVWGRTYSLTTRSLRVWRMLLASNRVLLAEVPLAAIDRIDVEYLSGQAFYRAGDLVLRSADGNVLARLDGVQRPEVFRRNILEARAARLQTEASLAAIQQRKSD